MKHLVIALSSLFLVILFFQSCANDAITFTERTSSEIAADNNDALGDYGTGGGGFDCVSGQQLSIYLDPDSSGTIVKDNYLGAIVSYEGTDTAADNYDYFSASAHPRVGPTPTGFEANIFFYDGGDGLALNFFANIDAGGSDDNIVNMDIQVENNAADDNVLLSDDGHELKEVSDHNYEGRFRYWKNTDGGVVGPFDKNSKFVIKVQFQASGDISKARFYSANGFDFSLGDAAGDVKSFILANESYQTCQ